jgi:predicted transcriptional regulator
MINLPIYKRELYKSRETSQALVDLLKKNTDKNGAIMMSQTEVARELKCSQSLISQLYTRLSLNDPCIAKISRGVYRLNYSNLADRGLYVTLLKCIEKIERDEAGEITKYSEYHLMNTSLKAAYLGIEKSEVKILDGFINIV